MANNNNSNDRTPSDRPDPRNDPRAGEWASGRDGGAHRSHYESQVGHYGAGSYNSGNFDTGYGSGGFGGGDYSYNSGYANGMNSGYGGYDDRQQRMTDPQTTRGRWNRDEQSRMGRDQGAGQSGYGSGQARGPQNYGQRSVTDWHGIAPDHPMMNQRGLGHAGKGPANFQRNDERIREDVCQHLSDHDDIDASQIEVAVSGGEVTLSGSVDHRSTKRLAEDIAHHVSGVKDVQNQIRIGASDPAQRGTSAVLASTANGGKKSSTTPS